MDKNNLLPDEYVVRTKRMMVVIIIIIVTKIIYLIFKGYANANFMQ